MTELPVLNNKPTTCLDNLHICKASCCRVFQLKAVCRRGSPLEDYLQKRGMVFTRIDRNFISITINHTCDQLTADYTCSLHGTPKKPLFCKALNENTAKSGRFMITEGCIYGDTDV